MVSKEALLRKLEPFLLPAIVALVGLGAFGLGRLSAPGAAGPRLIITMPDGTQAAAAAEAPAQSGGAAAPSSASQGGDYVGSKSGTKYYLSTCSGASRIKPENLVHFASVQEAEAAGYTPAANCPGL